MTVKGTLALLLSADPADQANGRLNRAALPAAERRLVDAQVLSALGCAAGSVRLGLLAPAPPHPLEEVRGSNGESARLAVSRPSAFDIIPLGERLVVLPTDAKGAGHAAVVLDAIDRLSIMPGKTMVIWNDEAPYPESMEWPNRIIVRYPYNLGWAGISKGLAYAYRVAISEQYGWVIKLDTDTALLARGFDAKLCASCSLHGQIGTMVDVTRCGLLPDGTSLYNPELAASFPWARKLVDSGLRRFDHIQGGCYVFGRKALIRMEQAVGLRKADQSDIPKHWHVGEDVLFDTMAKVAGVHQDNSRAVCSWWKCEGLDREPSAVALDHVRYHRDVEGVVAWHPVKHLPTLKLLADEAAGVDAKAETAVMEAVHG